MKRFLTHTLCAVTLTMAAVNTHQLEAMIPTLEQCEENISKKINDSLQVLLIKKDTVDEKTLQNEFDTAVYSVHFWLGKCSELYTTNNHFDTAITKLNDFLTKVKNAKVIVSFPIIIKNIERFKTDLIVKARKLTGLTWTPTKISEWAQKWIKDMNDTLKTLEEEQDPENEKVSAKNIKKLENTDNNNFENENEAFDEIENEVKLNNNLNGLSDSLKKRNLAKKAADLCAEKAKEKIIKKVKSSTNDLTIAWENIQPEESDFFGFIYGGNKKNPFEEENTQNFIDFVTQLHATIKTWKYAIDINIIHDDIKNCGQLIYTIKKDLPGMLKTWFKAKRNAIYNIIETGQKIMTSLTDKGALFNLDEKEKNQPYFETISEIKNALNK